MQSRVNFQGRTHIADPIFSMWMPIICRVSGTVICRIWFQVNYISNTSTERHPKGLTFNILVYNNDHGFIQVIIITAYTAGIVCLNKYFPWWSEHVKIPADITKILGIVTGLWLAQMAMAWFTGNELILKVVSTCYLFLCFSIGLLLVFRTNTAFVTLLNYLIPIIKSLKILEAIFFNNFLNLTQSQIWQVIAIT